MVGIFRPSDGTAMKTVLLKAFRAASTAKQTASFPGKTLFLFFPQQDKAKPHSAHIQSLQVPNWSTIHCKGKVWIVLKEQSTTKETLKC